MDSRVLIMGLGDIGRRLALRLVECRSVGEVVLAGRRREAGRALAGTAAACGPKRVRYVELDVSVQRDVEQVLRRERPELLIQCASKLSPWFLRKSDSPGARAIIAAGFAAQLPAQLPLVTTVMQAARSVDFQGHIVNCSYPDVTHPVLAARDLAPTLGIGNVGMIRSRACANYMARERSGAPPLVRVLGHHGQVPSVMSSAPPRDSELRPRIYIGEDAVRADKLAYEGAPIPLDVRLNDLTVASGMPILESLLSGASALRTSAPGPLGLPGGYPILIDDGAIRLDLPDSLSLPEARSLQARYGKLDGVERIDDDGCVHFTDVCAAHLREVHPALCEPLRPDQAEARLRKLVSALNV